MRLCFLLIVVVLAACSSDTPPSRPSDVLDEDSFVAVMTDVQILEATTRKKLIRDGDPRERTAQYYKQVFDKHNISQDEFERSYKWWSSNPEQMVVVYERILENLSQLEEETKPRKN